MAVTKDGVGSTADSVLNWQQQVYSFIGETWPKCTNNKYQTPNKPITQDVKKKAFYIHMQWKLRIQWHVLKLTSKVRTNKNFQRFNWKCCIQIRLWIKKSKHFEIDLICLPLTLFISKTITAESNHAGNYIRKLHTKKNLIEIGLEIKGNADIAWYNCSSLRWTLRKKNCIKIGWEIKL